MTKKNMICRIVSNCKLLFPVLMLTFSASTFSQLPSAFHLNSLSAKDTLLSGWKMYAGDDSSFVNPSLDDSKWLPIDLTRDIQQYPQFHVSGVIWLRLHLVIDSSLKDQLLAAHIEQYTASEVYLNGKLIQKNGIVNADPNKVVAWLPSAQPFLINFLKDQPNVIAVRVAYEPGIPYISYLNYNLPVFNLYINRHQSAAENYRSNEHQLKIYVIIFSINSGVLLIIGFIYLVYFLFDKSKKVHLYYALGMLALSLNALPVEVWGADRYGRVGLAMWVFYFEGVALTIGMLFLILTVFHLFNYQRRAIIMILNLLSVVMIAAMFKYGTPAFFAISYIFPALYLLEGLHVSIWAVRNHRKDASIILTGIIFYLLINILSAIIPIDSIAAQLLFYVAQMSFPIGMSFYLGIQSSLTNKQLRTAFAEVQTLSAKNLAQEREKQQLLANQNELLEQQVTERTAEVNRSLIELKSTQSQLIQSEKMASLGELTAGIAHEIQNPLNFVNNFSDVNKELLEELKVAADKGNINEIKAIAIDVIGNEEKINHHGKRADAIVKGMLQHSKQTSGTKELTDINQLADEYLKLAYHAMKGKENALDITLSRDFDYSVAKINIIPQEIGKVLFNLYNNALYAVAERNASLKALSNKTSTGGGENYEPTVKVSTKQSGNLTFITVSDNGHGIMPKIADKIFQPFFTTKPSGQGTGLGLSISYDIVKAYGGEISVNTRENEGSQFVIQLRTDI